MNKLLFCICIAIMAIIVACNLSSCTTARKNGCPTSIDGNPSYKFRG